MPILPFLSCINVLICMMSMLSTFILYFSTNSTLPNLVAGPLGSSTSFSIFSIIFIAGDQKNILAYINLNDRIPVLSPSGITRGSIW